MVRQGVCSCGILGFLWARVGIQPNSLWFKPRSKMKLHPSTDPLRKSQIAHCDSSAGFAAFVGVQEALDEFVLTSWISVFLFCSIHQLFRLSVALCFDHSSSIFSAKVKCLNVFFFLLLLLMFSSLLFFNRFYNDATRYCQLSLWERRHGECWAYLSEFPFFLLSWILNSWQLWELSNAFIYIYICILSSSSSYF